VHLGEFLTDTWLPTKRRHVRATTSYRYTWMVDNYINPAIGHVPLRRLRADHLDGLYDQLATTGGRHGTGLAPKTVHEVHVIVRSSLDLAMRRQLVDGERRPGHQRPPQAPDPHRPPVLDRRRTGVVPRRPDRHRLHPALHLTACTGMRRGEVAGLKWSDLDRANQRLSISRTLQSIAGQPVEFPVKTRTSRRCIDLDDATMDVLARWRRRLPRRTGPRRRRLDVRQHQPDGS
jgi:integrase